MRHSKIELTMNCYTDPRLLDVSGALDALPTLSLTIDPDETQIQAVATGTEGDTAKKFPQCFPPGTAHLMHSEAFLSLWRFNRPQDLTTIRST